MIDNIIKNIKSLLLSDDYKAVYSSFDNIPYYNKNKGISTYIGIPEFETRNPIYALNTVFIPFSGCLEISVAASLDCSADSLFSFFGEYILPRLSDSEFHIYEVKKITLKPDTNIKRLVLKCQLRISGIFRKENTAK